MSDFLICVRLVGPGHEPPAADWVQGELLSSGSFPGIEEGHPQWVFWIRPECEQVEEACQLQAEALGVGWELEGEGFTRCGIWEAGPGRSLCVDEVSFANIEVSGDPHIPMPQQPELTAD